MESVTGEQVENVAREALEAGEGLLRLAPTWVPRSFLQPGRSLKLHPEDYYALGKHRGGIDERWFGSTTAADNEGAPPRRGPQLSGLRREAVYPSRRGGMRRSAAHWRGHLEQVQALARLQQIFRQHQTF